MTKKNKVMSQKAGDVFVEISARTKKLDAAVKKSGSQIEKGFSNVNKKLSSQFAALGSTFAAAFAVDAIAKFSYEAIKLAGVAEGVKDAFERLNDPNLLKGLISATKGTVSELELMKQSVQAKNLGVPIQNLASLFEFATQRAAETGDSVSHLVQSITVGIGRKSPLILDNLGISAIDLRKALNGVSLETASVGQIAEAVGKIASESMKDIGDAALTGAQKIAVMNANIENLKVDIGRGLTPAFEKLLIAVDNTVFGLQKLGKDDLSAWEKFIGVANRLGIAYWVVQAANGDLLKSSRDATDGLNKQKNSQALLNKAVEMGLLSKDKAAIIDGKLSNLQYDFLANFHDEIKAWDGVTESCDNLTEAYGNQYDELVKLEKAQKAANTETERLIKLNKEADGIVGDMAWGGMGAGTDRAISTEGMAAVPELEEWGEWDNLDEFGDKLKENEEAAKVWASALQGAFSAVGSAMVQSLGLGETAMGRFAATMIQAAIDVIAQFLAIAIASAIAGGSSAGASTGTFAIFTTPAFIAGLVGTVLGAFAAIPAFATGGQSRGGMALVGERGPELVDLPGGSFVTPNHQMGRHGSTGGVEDMFFNGIVRGENIIIAGNRASRNNIRTNGGR